MPPTGPPLQTTCPLQPTAVISNVPLLNSVGQFNAKTFYASETRDCFPARQAKIEAEPHPANSCCLPEDLKNLDQWKGSVQHTDYVRKCGSPAEARFNQTTFYRTQFKLGGEPTPEEMETENERSFPCRPPVPLCRARPKKTHSSIYLSDGYNVASTQSHYHDNYVPLLGHSPAKTVQWLKGESPPIIKAQHLRTCGRSETADSYPLWETHPMVMGKAPIEDTEIIGKANIDIVNNSLHKDSFKPCINPKTKGFREKHYGSIVLGHVTDQSYWSVSTLDAVHPTLKTFAPEVCQPKKAPAPRSPAVQHPFREYAISAAQETYKPHCTIPEHIDPNKYRQSHLILADPDHIPFATTHHQRTFTLQPGRDCFPQVHYPPWKMGDPSHPEQKKSEMKTMYKPHQGAASAVNPFAANELQASHLKFFDVGQWLGSTTYKAHFSHDGCKEGGRNDSPKTHEYRTRIPYFTLPPVISSTAKPTLGVDDHLPIDFTRTLTLGPYQGCVPKKLGHTPNLNYIDDETKLYCKVTTEPC